MKIKKLKVNKLAKKKFKARVKGKVKKFIMNNYKNNMFVMENFFNEIYFFFNFFYNSVIKKNKKKNLLKNKKLNRYYNFNIFNINFFNNDLRYSQLFRNLVLKVIKKKKKVSKYFDARGWYWTKYGLGCFTLHSLLTFKTHYHDIQSKLRKFYKYSYKPSLVMYKYFLLFLPIRRLFYEFSATRYATYGDMISKVKPNFFLLLRNRRRLLRLSREYRLFFLFSALTFETMGSKGKSNHLFSNFLGLPRFEVTLLEQLGDLNKDKFTKIYLNKINRSLIKYVKVNIQKERDRFLVVKDSKIKKQYYKFKKFFYNSRKYNKQKLVYFSRNLNSKRIYLFKDFFKARLFFFRPDAAFNKVFDDRWDDWRKFYFYFLVLKQTIRRLFGNLRLKILYNIYYKAQKTSQNNFLVFLYQLENLLPYVLWRMGFIYSIKMGVDLIKRGFVFVNGNMIKNVNFIVQYGDCISVYDFKNSLFKYYGYLWMRLENLNRRRLGRRFKKFKRNINLILFFYKKARIMRRFRIFGGTVPYQPFLDSNYVINKRLGVGFVFNRLNYLVSNLFSLKSTHRFSSLYYFELFFLFNNLIKF